MKRRLFDHIASFPLHHAWVILIIALLVTVAAFVRVINLDFEWDLMKYVPQDVQSIRDFNEATKVFGSPQYILVTVEAEGEDRIGTRRDFVNHLVEELSASPLIKRSQFVIPDQQMKEITDFTLNHIFLYLTLQDIDDLKTRFSPEYIEEALKKNKPPQDSFFARLFANPLELLTNLTPGVQVRQKDPLGVYSLIRKYIMPRGLKFSKSKRNNYYVSHDRKMAFFLVEPTEPSWNLPATERLIEEMGSIIERVKGEHQQNDNILSHKRKAPPPIDDLRVSFAGYHTITLQNYRDLKRDTFFTLGVTFVGVIIIFLLGFRKVRFLPYAFIPLVAALIWTLGLASQLFTSINLFTCILAIMIVGLGIDFAIHLLNGYRSTLAKGTSVEQAWRASLTTCGPAVLCGAFTTIAVFGLLMLSDFPGGRQLGLLVAAGLIFVLVNVFLLMPALIKVVGAKRMESSMASPSDRVSRWLRSLIAFSLAHPKRVIVTAVILTLAIGVYIYPLQLNSESVEPFSKHSPSATTIERFTDKIGVFPNYVMAVSTGKTIPEVLGTSYVLYAGLLNLQEEGKIAQLDSPSRFLPPYDMQQRNLALLGKTRDLDYRFLRTHFVNSLNRQRIVSDYLRDQYLPMLLKILKPHDIVRLEDIEALGFADKMSRYLYKEPGRFQLVTYIFPIGNAYDQEGMNEAVDSIAELPIVKSGDVKLVGTHMINQDMREILSRNLKLIFACAVAAVLIILFVYFHNVKAVVLSLVPVLFGIVGMLAIFKLAGYALNFFNAIWLALILGIGVDSGVHMISRFKTTDGDVATALADVGRAVGMSTLTTLTAFGSMMLAVLPGLRSSGVLAGAGMIFSLIAALVILPALMELVLVKKGDEAKEVSP